MRASRFLTLLIAITAPALTSCAVTPPGGTTPSGAATPPIGTADATALTEKDSPLVQYLSSVFTAGNSPDATPEEQQAFRNEREQRRQELVAGCMKEQGFEYVPVLAPDAQPAEAVDWRPDDRDWVEKYGYGVVRNPYQDAPGPEPSEPIDPNQSYLDSLTEAEQEAYFEALNGNPRPVTEGAEAPEWTWEDSGCFGRAYHEIEGKDPWQQAENQPIMEALRSLYDQIQSGPEFAELEADWAACMAEAGHPGFTKQLDALNSIYQLTDRYWEDSSAKDDGSEQDPTPGTMQDPTYAKLSEQEIPLALADLECRQKTDYRQTQLRIRFVAEEQFVADHAEELDAMKARAEQSKK